MQFPAKKNAGCPKAPSDFPPRKDGIHHPLSGCLRTLPSPRVCTGGRAYADVTTKISRFDRLPNFLTNGALLGGLWPQRSSFITQEGLFDIICSFSFNIFFVLRGHNFRRCEKKSGVQQLCCQGAGLLEPCSPSDRIRYRNCVKINGGLCPLLRCALCV